MRFCIVLQIAIFILQGTSISKRGRPGSAGVLRKTGSADIWIKADVTLWLGGALTCSDPNDSAVCDKFIHDMRAAVGLLIAAFLSTPIALAIISAGIVQLARTTNAMVVGFWCSIFFPFIATLVSVGIFFNNVVPNLQDAVGYHDGFTRGVCVDLVVASCALHCLGFVLATGRLMVAVFIRPAEKRSVIQSKNIEMVMTLHMVNDDWERQKRVWAGHKDMVQAQFDEEERRACTACIRDASPAAHEPTAQADRRDNSITEFNDTRNSVLQDAGESITNVPH